MANNNNKNNVTEKSRMSDEEWRVRRRINTSDAAALFHEQKLPYAPNSTEENKTLNSLYGDNIGYGIQEAWINVKRWSNSWKFSVGMDGIRVVDKVDYYQQRANDKTLSDEDRAEARLERAVAIRDDKRYETELQKVNNNREHNNRLIQYAKNNANDHKGDWETVRGLISPFWSDNDRARTVSIMYQKQQEVQRLNPNQSKMQQVNEMYRNRYGERHFNDMEALDKARITADIGMKPKGMDGIPFANEHKTATGENLLETLRRAQETIKESQTPKMLINNSNHHKP